MRRAWKCQGKREFPTVRSIGLLIGAILLIGALAAEVEDEVRHLITVLSR